MKKLQIKKSLPRLLGSAAGGAGSLVLEHFIPLPKPDLKSAVSIGIGVVLGSMGGMIGDIGAGVVAGSSRGYAAKLLPKMGITGPFIGEPDGSEDYPVLVNGPDNTQAMEYVYDQTIQGVQPEYSN